MKIKLMSNELQFSTMGRRVSLGFNDNGFYALMSNTTKRYRCGSKDITMQAIIVIAGVIAMIITPFIA